MLNTLIFTQTTQNDIYSNTLTNNK